MNLYNLFKTDPKLEQDGIWVDYGNNSKGDPIRFRVARAGGANKRYAKQLEKVTRPHRKAIQSGLLDNDLADQLFKEVFADTVLLGWEGVEDAEGNPLSYSRETAMKLFKDLPDLYADIREQANNIGLYREQLLEDSLGNSGMS